MKAQAIVQHMLSSDAFSQWLGIVLEEIHAGYAQVSMTVRSEMLNGFGIAHGGIAYSLADSAFAFASNAQGKHAVSIETSISHTRPIACGDRLTAIAQEDHLSKHVGVYTIRVNNQHKQTVALFKGTVFRKQTPWESTTHDSMRHEA